MAERSVFIARELRFLRAMIDNQVDFIIVGLSAALLQGAPAVTQDIELWVKDPQGPRLRRALRKVGAALIPQVGMNPPMLAGENVQFFDLVVQMSGLGSFDEEIEHAIRMEVEGIELRVLSLDRIIVSKQATDREKDRLVLPVLRDTARTLEALRKTRGKPGNRRK